MARVVAIAAVAAAASTLVAAIPSCNEESNCKWTIQYKGSPWDLDLRGLCNRNHDYVLSDDSGHTYYAQVCGTANKACYPLTYQNEYAYGKVVQSWGSPPPCNNECVDEETNAPVCCSEDCQVVAVSAPSFRLIDPADATKGFELFYVGETPTLSDPYPCDYDPVTYQQYPRTTHLQFFCDANVDGFANFFEVDNNATDDCDYTLKFKTSRACLPGQVGLSGGWIFNILLLVFSSVYVIAAVAWNKHKLGSWSLPPSHAAFWSDFNSLVFEGVLFIVAGCKKPRLKPGFAAAGSSSSSGGAGATASYHSVATTEATEGASATRSAYTDL